MNISVNDLVMEIIKASKKNIKIKNDLSGPTIKTNVCLDCKRAEEELNWVPKTSLNEGLKKTISWWQDNIDPNTLKIKVN